MRLAEKKQKMCCSTLDETQRDVFANSYTAFAFESSVMHGTSITCGNHIPHYSLSDMRDFRPILASNAGECWGKSDMHSSVLKCDSGNSSSGSSGSSQRILDTESSNTNTAGRDRERYLLELRLRWAIRRLQEHIRVMIQRKCEMRLFVVLRMQYVYRSRVRAARVIQKFVRERLYHCRRLIDST